MNHRHHTLSLLTEQECAPTLFSTPERMAFLQLAADFLVSSSCFGRLESLMFY
jgi:hypothetical protein